jgi:hypothetical protein
MNKPPRTHVETLIMVPDALQGELEPPPIGEGWHGGAWELVSVSIGPRLHADDPHSPVWFCISWRRR